jgi:hypothetical protein
MHSRSVFLASSLCLLTLVCSSHGPVSATPQESQPPPFLLTLKGASVIVNYTPGGLDRAYHVQRRLELLVEDFTKSVKNPLRLRVFVLNRDEWSEFGFGLPFGLPGRIRASTLAVPWLGDEGTIELWTRIMGSPPPPLPGIPMRGTAEEATTLAYSDLLTEVEAARALMTMGGVRGEIPWVHQVLAHLLARDAFIRYEGPRLAEIDGFFADLGRSQPIAPLERYVEGLDLETLLWFESRFQDGARRVLENGKRNEAREIIKMARKAGGTLTEGALLGRHPQLIGWLAEAFGGG